MSQRPDDATPSVANQVTGDVFGTVVQAASVGGVHVHSPAARPVMALPYRTGTVPPRSAGFQTRATTEQLITALEHDPMVVLTSDSAARTGVVSGMGGVGKTQIAADYAERLWSTGKVELLVWVTATSRDAIVSSYADLATDLTGINDLNPDRDARRLLGLLVAMGTRWLVVLDDVQNPADLRGLWPPATGIGRTVVTTRRRDAALRGHGRTVIEVEVFTPQEARAYLGTVLADHPALRQGMEPLAAALGYLPLALAQASAYMLDRDLSCADYLTRWGDQRRKLAALVPEPDGLPDEHRATVAATWSLSIEQANRLEPAGVARPLLEMASFLDPNGIPASVFGAPAAVALLSDTAGHEVSAEQAHDGLGCLRRLSLITMDTDSAARSVRAHGLVQRATRDRMPVDRVPVVARAAAEAVVQVWPAVECDALLGEVLRTNATTLAETAGKHLWAPDIPALWFRAGGSLGEAGLTVEARDYFHRLYTSATAHLDPDHPDTLTTRSHLAYWRGASGDTAGAVTAFEQLLTDRLRVLGPDHHNTLTTRGHLARWRGQSGDVAGAVTAFEQLLTDALRVLGAKHPDTIRIRGNLAYLRGKSGDAVGAVTAFEQVLTDNLRVLGPDHPSTLITRYNLAHWRGESGDVAGAVTAYEQLLTDRLRVLGPDHPDTLITRYNLEDWRGHSGDVAGAVTAFEQLLTDRLRVLGPDHPDTLATRNNLAYWRKGESRAVPSGLPKT